ncbi:hypothetical protein GCM10023310_64240 [Paenibacillus vulneris]
MPPAAVEIVYKADASSCSIYPSLPYTFRVRFKQKRSFKERLGGKMPFAVDAQTGNLFKSAARAAFWKCTGV